MKKRGMKQGIAALVAAVMTIAAPGNVFAQAKQTADLNSAGETPSVAEEPAAQPDMEPELVGELEDRREENVKQYLMSDGSIAAAVYGAPVHYQDNGLWEEIDNRLSEETAGDEDGAEEAVLSNGKNDFKVKFAKQGDSKKLVRLQKGSHKVSWELVGARKVKAEQEPAAEDSPEQEDKTAVKHQSGVVTYKDVLPHVDVRYTVSAKRVKEDIILKDKEAQGTYQLLFEAKSSQCRKTRTGASRWPTRKSRRNPCSSWTRRMCTTGL